MRLRSRPASATTEARPALDARSEFAEIFGRSLRAPATAKPTATADELDMKIIRTINQMQRLAKAHQRAGKRVGFVPTMGALHEGHASLIREAARRNDVTVVSIFVNPLQFGPSEDYRKYPRTLAQDVRLAKAAGAGVVFAPEAAQMYPAGFRAFIEVEGLSDRWEGASRPGHFRGVATVVLKLFQAVQPAAAYFGQKDYQQSQIIRRMVSDLNLPLEVHVMPTVRERDGLAMSSRNRYLSPGERAKATVLIRALRAAQARILDGERNPRRVMEAMRRIFRLAPSVRLDYAAVVDAQTLEPVARVRGKTALLVAAWVGPTRLIDNLLVEVS